MSALTEMHPLDLLKANIAKIDDALMPLLTDSIINDLTKLNKKLESFMNRKNVSYFKENKPMKCLKCNETNPKYFNRKLTECTPCMSKEFYSTTLTQKVDEGKERNIKARLDRVHCADCKTTVTRETAQMFDWDHRDPTEKSYAISRMNCRSDDLFFAEIAKCDLVCKMCHVNRTKTQFQLKQLVTRKSYREMYNKK